MSSILYNSQWKRVATRFRSCAPVASSQSELAGTAGVAPHPQALQPAAEPTKESARPRNGEVVQPALVDPPEPFAHLPDVVVPALAEHLVDARQGPVDPFGDRFATKPEASSPGRRAMMRETQEVECLRLVQPRAGVASLPRTARTPNSTRRVLSGWRLRPNRVSLSRRSRRYCSASRLCWNRLRYRRRSGR